MTPRFSFMKKGKWKLTLTGTPEEVEILRSTKRFNHRVVLSFKDKHYDPYVGKDVTEDCVTTLDDFADEHSPLGSYWTFRFSNELEVEEWEAQVTKRVKVITDEIAELIPEAEPTTPNISERDAFYHMLLIAQTRWGKTNAISWRLSQVLPLVERGEASVILMEPKGVLIDDLLHLSAVWAMRDRVIIIDPEDTPVAVNIFDKGDGSPGALNDGLGRILSVLSTITTDLTPFQRDALTFSIRALFAMPDAAALDTLKDILRHGIGDIPNLSPAVAEFFEKDFKSGKGQAGQIISRLNGLVANPIFEALFAAKQSTVDIGEEMQNGRLIVIRVNERALGGEKAAELYGRFWIEQVAKTVFPRLSLPREQRKPVLFIIDEAQLYIKEDRRLAAILDTAAEARIGMLLAVHHMSQIEDARVRDSMYTNCMLKFSARTSADIHNLGRSMGDSEVAIDLINKVKRFEFAYHGPDMDRAMKVKFPLVEFSSMPRVSEDQYQELRRFSRERYGYTSARESKQPDPPPPPEELGFGKL